MEWRWKFSKGSYKPGGKGYANIWVKNDSSSLYVSDVGIWFDWLHDEYWFKRCGRRIPSHTDHFLTRVGFDVPRQVVLGNHEYAVGIDLGGNGKEINWSAKHSLEVSYPLRHRAFLACSLWDRDRELVNFFRKWLKYYGIRPRTVGIDIKPEYLDTPQYIESEVRRADCLIGVFSPRYQINGHLPTEWNIWESASMYREKKPIYIFHEEGTEVTKPVRITASRIFEFNRYQLYEEEGVRRITGRIGEIREELVRSKRSGLIGLGVLGLILLGALAISRS